MVGRKGILKNRNQYNLIRARLSPDSRRGFTDAKLTEAKILLESFEKKLLGERDSPTDFPDLPDNIAEWDRNRARSRRSTRSANPVGRRA